MVFFAQAFSQFCKKISPIRYILIIDEVLGRVYNSYYRYSSYVEPIFKDTDKDPLHGDYTPNVLKNALKHKDGESSEKSEDDISDDKSVSDNKGYGTFADDLVVIDQSTEQLL